MALLGGTGARASLASLFLSSSLSTCLAFSLLCRIPTNLPASSGFVGGRPGPWSSLLLLLENLFLLVISHGDGVVIKGFDVVVVFNLDVFTPRLPFLGQPSVVVADHARRERNLSPCTVGHIATGGTCGIFRPTCAGDSLLSPLERKVKIGHLDALHACYPLHHDDWRSAKRRGWPPAVTRIRRRPTTSSRHTARQPARRPRRSRARKGDYL